MLVHHHIKYKEIHGVDEVVLMDKREHKRLHARLRREGKCNIPVPVLDRISNKAHKRRDEVRERERERHREYNAKRYAEDPAFREHQRERDAKWRAENKEQVREYLAKRRTVFPRLRPDIVNAALTGPCAAL